MPIYLNGLTVTQFWRLLKAFQARLEAEKPVETIDSGLTCTWHFQTGPAEKTLIRGTWDPVQGKAVIGIPPYAPFDPDGLAPPPERPALALVPTPPAAPYDDGNFEAWARTVGRDGVRIPYGDDYLRSTHWELVRDAYLTGRCAECKRQIRTELHHLTYARVGHERPEDLLELCRACHEGRHVQRVKKAA